MAENPSRTSILKTAGDLMLKYGYAVTSVDEICSKARVTKGSLYHFFATKEELGLAVLNEFYERGVARVARGAYVGMNDPYQCLLGLLDHLETIGPDLWRRGCLMGNFACEFAESSQVIWQRVARMFEELANRLSPIFQPIARDRKQADELAEQTLMVIEGAVIMATGRLPALRVARGDGWSARDGHSSRAVLRRLLLAIDAAFVRRRHDERGVVRRACRSRSRRKSFARRALARAHGRCRTRSVRWRLGRRHLVAAAAGVV
jgi:TetR/AcrR family transcriptional repressor of nem operon